MNVSVLGAGAWGTALAISAARRQHAQVLLWGRDAEQIEQLRQDRRNDRYLPGIGRPSSLALSADWDAAVAHAGTEGLIIIGTPMAALADMLARLPPEAAVLWLCKGFDKATG